MIMNCGPMRISAAMTNGVSLSSLERHPTERSRDRFMAPPFLNLSREAL
jgi:hypothetical protein